MTPGDVHIRLRAFLSGLLKNRLVVCDAWFAFTVAEVSELFSVLSFSCVCLVPVRCVSCVPSHVTSFFVRFSSRNIGKRVHLQTFCVCVTLEMRFDIGGGECVVVFARMFSLSVCIFVWLCMLPRLDSLLLAVCTVHSCMHRCVCERAERK